MTWVCVLISVSDEASNDVPHCSAKKSKLAQMLDEDDVAINRETDAPPADKTVTSNSLASKQFDSYVTLAEKLPHLMFDDNPLHWWSKYSQLLPELSWLARQYLAMQATSCASERLFSKAGYIVNKHRNKLSPPVVAMLTFMATNDQ